MRTLLLALVLRKCVIVIWIFRNKYKSFEKKNSSKVFRFLKMTVLLKDPKGALWCSMTSKKNLCGLIKNSEAFKWLLSERCCTN